MRLEKYTLVAPVRTGFVTSLFLFASFFAVQSDLNAQCYANCGDHFYLSLDEDCEYMVTAADVAKNYLGCTNPVVTLSDAHGRDVPNPVTKNYRGYTLTYRMSTDEGYTCWGYVTFEDKFAPAIMCNDTLVDCWQAESFLNPDISDNCGYDATIRELNRIWVDFGCEVDDTVGYIQRDVVTTDIWGNSNRCMGQRLYIRRESLDSVVCDEDPTLIECCETRIKDGEEVYVLWDPKYVYEDEDGYSHPIPMAGGLVEPPYIANGLLRHYIIPASNNKGKCNIVADYKDHIIPTCGSTYKIRREWKLFDWCTNESTSCVQWIKIVDQEPPLLAQDSEGKEVCLDVDYPLTGICTESEFAWDFTNYDDGCILPRTFHVNPHDCKAHVSLYRPEILKECGLLFAKGDPTKEAEALAKISVTYQIAYADHKHPGKVIVETGEIPYGSSATVYLPGGWYQVIYFIKDECWNEALACEVIAVEDNTPPTPVCDELTQVTLDPETCWIRVPAKELDDGSRDNCAHKLHYAIASMDSIEYYRDYWEDQLIECVGQYEYNHYYEIYKNKIEDWINCFVFNDYADLTECGQEMVVLRVYEADGLPLYDPHVFAGSEHQWFCFNLYDDYACFFKWNYDKFSSYEHPRIDLCNYTLIEEVEENECFEGSDALQYAFLKDPNCQCTNAMPQQGCTTCDGDYFGIMNRAIDAEASLSGIGQFGFLHGAIPNRSCCVFESDMASTTQAQTWQDLTSEYPELRFLDCKRYKFKHLYSDCMIEVIKDDKEPPVCIPPADETFYCDGVPYSGFITPNGGNNKLFFNGAQFAHDICDESDTWDPNCIWDRTDDPAVDYTAPGDWCVKAGWNSVHGYYMGPSADEYHYEDPCNDDFLEWYPDRDNWKPIYCRFWLMLDVFDQFDENGVEDKGKPNAYTYFGTPEISDNCWYPEVDSTTSGDLDECGVGILTRTWTVTDKCGNTSECYQRIVIKPRSDFEVKFPADLEIYCDEVESLDPVKGDPESYPVVTDDDCELIGITYSDQTLDVFEDGCYKILRTWKVIDWCVYVPDLHHRYPDVIVDDRCVADEDSRPCVYRQLKDDGDGFMTYLQVIKIVDDNLPIVTCNDSLMVCIYDENCEDADVTYVLGTAIDSCSDELEYRYAINPNGDSDESDWIYGIGNEVQNTLPVGIHTAILYAKDDCGNEGMCETVIEVKDCKPPTPYCYEGIATVIMPSTNEVTVWARDLDAGSFDNCTIAENLRFTFGDVHPDEDELYSDEDKSSSESFDCDDLGQVEVTIYVWDETGNRDFCKTFLSIQPGTEACDGTTAAVIKGHITTENDEAVEFAQVELSTTSGTNPSYMTGADGLFSFKGVQMNSDYVIKPTRNDEHDNGVSTLDLVLIQKHILGLEKMTSPYKIIASDINNTGTVTALDLVELRRLILGIYDELPSNSSWRFVDAAYEFDEVTSPWGFPESVEVKNMSQPEMEANFYGIKVGDVNYSAKSHSFHGAEIRSTASPLVLQIEDEEVLQGEQVSLTFASQNFEQIEGYQFTMALSGLQVQSIEGGAIQMQEENFGVFDQYVTTSWNSSAGVSTSEALFTLHVLVTSDGVLSEMIDINSNKTTAEAYRGNTVMDVQLSFAGQNSNHSLEDNGYSLLQNTPNPFSDKSMIGFALPESAKATIQIFDMAGQLVYQIDQSFAKGFNQISVSKEKLQGSGVYYYQLKSGSFTASKKMILMQ